MFPDAHSQAVSDITVQPLAQTFHASDFEVVNPSSDKLIKFVHLIGITYSPVPACQLSHLRLKLCNCLLVRSGFVCFGE